MVEGFFFMAAAVRCAVARSTNYQPARNARDDILGNTATN
jgi:hypothetical protein